MHALLCQEDKIVFTGPDVSPSFPKLLGYHHIITSSETREKLQHPECLGQLSKRPVSLQCPAVAQSQQEANRGGLWAAVCLGAASGSDPLSSSIVSSPVATNTTPHQAHWALLAMPQGEESNPTVRRWMSWERSPICVTVPSEGAICKMGSSLVSTQG